MERRESGSGGAPGESAPVPAPPEAEDSSGAKPLSDLRNNGPVLAYSRAKATPSRSRRQIWARRLWTFVFALICMDLGLALIVLPWKASWTTGPVLMRFPELRPLVGSYFFRGLLTGLGLVNLWIGVWEAVHYTDYDDQ